MEIAKGCEANVCVVPVVADAVSVNGGVARFVKSAAVSDTAALSPHVDVAIVLLKI